MKKNWHDCWLEAEKERFGVTERTCSCGARMVYDPASGIWLKLPDEKKPGPEVEFKDGSLYAAG